MEAPSDGLLGRIFYVDGRLDGERGGGGGKVGEAHF